MSDALAQARQLIERRLSELQAEAARLDKALRELGARPADIQTTAVEVYDVQGSGNKLGSARSRSKVRAPRGQRQRDFLAAVEAKPGIRASEIAKQLGISGNQTYGLAQTLRKQGRVRRRGKGYALSPAKDSS